jgi:hypothetical protein
VDHCFRAANYWRALWRQPNPPARFNHAGDGPTQYLALHPLGPWAELVRTAARSGFSNLSALATEIRARTWVLKVDLSEMPRLDFDTAATFGLAAEDVVADDQSSCRDLGRRLRADGERGVVYLSAALPGTWNVALFGEFWESPFDAEPVSIRDVPASISADRGGVLMSLLNQIRLPGQLHAGLEAWRLDIELTFEEPSFELVA